MKVKNRRCITHLSRCTLRAGGRRNLIAVAAIALTALLFTTLFTVLLSINDSYESYTFRQIGGYAHGSFKNVTEEQAGQLSAHPLIRESGARLVLGVITDGAFAKKTAEVSYMDANCSAWSYAKPEVGHMPQGGREITMDRTALELLGVQPQTGAQVQLTYELMCGDQCIGRRTDTFTLVGWWEADKLMPVHYINVSQEYAKQVEQEMLAAGNEPFHRDLNVMLSSAADIRGQLEQTAQDSGYTLDERASDTSVQIGVNWGYTASVLDEGMDLTTVAAIAAFLLLVIITGYLIIYNIFQISVSGDIRFYGLLKTIGVTPRQLRRMVRRQALILCGAGVPLGLLLGYGIGVVLTPMVIRSLSEQNPVCISTSPWIFPAAAVFALLTVWLSCLRPAKLAARVSPVEAVRYTEQSGVKKKRHATRGAGIVRMAFANLGRNRKKTLLVVSSLALSFVLLDLLLAFTGGFDMETYLEKQSCADFLVSGSDYFHYSSEHADRITQEQMRSLDERLNTKDAGCGYEADGAALCYMSEQAWRADSAWFYTSQEQIEAALEMSRASDGTIMQTAQIEGMDAALLDKLTVLDGSIEPLRRQQEHMIAFVVQMDDYGNPIVPEDCPAIGETQKVTYAKDVMYVDGRTGAFCDENTPQEYIRREPVEGCDVEYTVCAYVAVPYQMSFRYYEQGYRYVLPAERLEADSGAQVHPLFYLFDTPDEAAEQEAEAYLSGLTAGAASTLMYESKATLREEFLGFQQIFLLMGGLLCAVIGVVGVLNFLNAVLTGILSRRREFAILQAVGMTGRQLQRMLVAEGLCYTLGSAAAAIVLSAVCSPLINRLFAQMFWFYRENVTVVPVLIMLPLLAFLGWLIPFVTYRYGRKSSVVEQLRESP